MIILDTSIWIALLKKNDSCHDKAKALVENVSPSDLQIEDHIFAEALTVIRNKISDSACQNFLKFLSNSGITIQISDQNILKLATQYFIQNNKLSFVDSIILASAKVNNAHLLTFDKHLIKAWENLKK